MFWIRLVLILLLAGATGFAEETPARQAVQRDRIAAADLIAAATNRAVSSLFQQVAEMSLTPDLTVGKFVKDMDQAEEFTRALQRANQMGGPRWIDEQTCQVQLQMPATEIAYDLRRIAAAYPNASPLRADQIERAVNNWPRRVFSATGAATSPSKLVAFRPAPNPVWSRVNDAERRRVLAAANQQAATAAIDSVSTVDLHNGKTVGDAMSNREIGEAVRNWLVTRPVTEVDFREDLEVRVSLGVEGRDFFNVVRTAVSRQGDRVVPADQVDWKRVETDFRARFSPPVGRASVADRPEPRVVRQGVPLPARAPDWIDQRVEVQGVATGTGPKLRMAIAAETEGRVKLRTRLDSLPLDRDFTLGEAARRDPRIEAALRRFVQQTRVYRTEYRTEGPTVSVTVRMLADLRALWDEIRR